MAQSKPNNGSPNSAPVELGVSDRLWPDGIGPNFLILALISTVVFWDVFTHPHLMLWASDIVRAHSTYKIVQWRSWWEYGSFPLWDPTVFCGKSIVGDPLPAVLNPFAVLFWLIPSPSLFGFYFWFYITLGAWGMFLFARERECTPVGAVLAATAFALSGKTAGHVFAGHAELLSTALGFPWILWAVERICKKPGFGRAVLLGLVLTLTATCGSVQMMYLHTLFATAYLALRMLPDVFAKAYGAVAIRGATYVGGFVVFALGGAAWWFPIMRQTLLLSARSEGVTFEFATMNSMGYGDLWRFIWPFQGQPAPQALQGDAANAFFWETANYPGIITLCLAIAAVVVLKNRYQVWSLAGLAILAIMLALGEHSPFYWLAFHVVPGFKLFRAPGRMLFYANFFVAILAGMFLSQERIARYRWFLPVLVCVTLESALLLPLVLPASILKPGFGTWWPLAITGILAPLSILWAYGALKPPHWRVLAVVLLVIELFYIWQPHINMVATKRVLPSLAAAEFLEKRRQEEVFRIYDPTFTIDQQIAARHGLEIITGYHPGIYAHHLDLYKKLWRQDDSDLVELRMHSPSELGCPNILDLMNVKYVMAYEPYLGPEYERVFTTPAHEFEQPRHVFRREAGLPRVFLVAKAIMPQQDRAAIDELCALNPKQECVVEADPVEGSAEYQEISAKRNAFGDWTLSFTTDHPGIVVLSESWHPDWRATDGNKPLEIRRVNYGQIGIPISPGEHMLRVRYYPRDFFLGCLLSASTWGLLVALTLTLMLIRRKMSVRHDGPAAL